MFTPAASLMGLAFSGRCGKLTWHSKLGHVDLDDVFVYSIEVTLVDFIVALGAPLDVVQSYVIRLDDPVLAACLDGHIAHREPPGHSESLDGFTVNSMEQ